MPSKYLNWINRDVQPDEPLHLTPKQKRQNWWFYHKWYVVIGIVLLLIAGDIGWHVLGIGQVQPDYQVAYVGNGALPTDTVDALEQSLAALGQDCNGDGQVVVKVNQYVTKAASDDDSATYAAASTVKLMADLDSCDSYFFLLEDPEQFQKDYLILRRLDGELPSENDRDTDRYFLNWSDCPVLETLALGEYSEVTLGRTISGDSQELLSALSLARRGFWTQKASPNLEGCDALWEILTEGADL